ncbi:MAG: YeeE/YedE thiosulfate transporter family protein [Persephonella sp.]|nr:YeeE/YedE thiosulfate transporter family protein [Persephonella sp.]
MFAFLGGFLLIFGARMAGGCTSGLMFSGGMQLAVSSLLFCIFAFAGGLITCPSDLQNEAQIMLKVLFLGMIFR